jgi:hypothetical protein
MFLAMFAKLRHFQPVLQDFLIFVGKMSDGFASGTLEFAQIVL